MTIPTEFKLAQPEQHPRQDGAPGVVTVHGRFWLVTNAAQHSRGTAVRATTPGAALTQYELQNPRVRAVSIHEYTWHDEGQGVSNLPVHTFGFGTKSAYESRRAYKVKNDAGQGQASAQLVRQWSEPATAD